MTSVSYVLGYQTEKGDLIGKNINSLLIIFEKLKNSVSLTKF